LHLNSEKMPPSSSSSSSSSSPSFTSSDPSLLLIQQQEAEDGNRKVNPQLTICSKNQKPRTFLLKESGQMAI
jgi:hypothetical protein